MTKTTFTGSNTPDEPTHPLFVMGIEDGWCGTADRMCVFAAVRLTPAVVQAMQSLSTLSREAELTALAVTGWPLLWDAESLLNIATTTWHALGRRQWAECHDGAGALIGRTISLDVRELDMLRAGDDVVWHETDDSAFAAEQVLAAGPFEHAAWLRLIAQGWTISDKEPNRSSADARRMNLELDDVCESDEPPPRRLAR